MCVCDGVSWLTTQFQYRNFVWSLLIWRIFYIITHNEKKKKKRNFENVSLSFFLLNFLLCLDSFSVHYGVAVMCVSYKLRSIKTFPCEFLSFFLCLSVTVFFLCFWWFRELWNDQRNVLFCCVIKNTTAKLKKKHTFDISFLRFFFVT